MLVELIVDNEVWFGLPEYEYPEEIEYEEPESKRIRRAIRISDYK